MKNILKILNGGNLMFKSIKTKISAITALTIVVGVVIILLVKFFT